ncbi:MAG: hypothetical protein ACRD9R_19895 [Pyrinomonadaceae bacterium]
MPSSENRYLLEIDGVTAITATDVTMPGKKHTPFKHQPGNLPRPELGRGNYEIEEMTFMHAHGVGSAGEEIVAWMDAYLSGLLVEKRSARFIVLDEAGRIPVAVYEMIDCVPTMFKAEKHTGSGTNISQFSFSLQPTDMYMV